MKYEIDGSRLLVSQSDGSAKEVSFKWPIAQVLETRSVLVVRVEPKPKARDNRNVFGIALNARILWQVVQQQHIYDDSPYTGMSIVDEGVLLSNWDGTDLVVDTTTGEVISQSQGK